VSTDRATRNKLGIANCIEALAGIALERGHVEAATRLLGAVEALLELVGGSVQWGGRVRFERDRDMARARLGDHAFARARADGRALVLDEAIAYALSDATSP
jgi:hypothetical protein